MPFYEYECSACKFYVEALQKVSDAPMKKCPSCKKPTLKKLISAPAFRLSGSGWYETDFKSEKEQKRNLVGEDKESSSEAKAESSESKPSEPKAAETKAADNKAEKPAVKGKSASKKPTPKSKPKPKAAAKKAK